MEVVYQVPTSKQIARQCNRDERLQVHTLYNITGYERDEICLQLNLTPDQVRYALTHRLTPQKKTKCGRKILLNPPQ